MNNTKVLESLQDFVNDLTERSRGNPIEVVYIAIRNNKFEARALNDDTIIHEVEEFWTS